MFGVPVRVRLEKIRGGDDVSVVQRPAHELNP